MSSFIDAHCPVPIAPSTYYEVIAKRDDVDRLSARARRDIAMKVEIPRVFNENIQVYGSSGLRYVRDRRPIWGRLPTVGFRVTRTLQQPSTLCCHPCNDCVFNSVDDSVPCLARRSGLEMR